MGAENNSNRTRCVSRGNWLYVFRQAEDTDGSKSFLREK